MLALAVDQRRDRPAVEIVDAAAQEHRAGQLQLADRRREVELRRQPGLDGVMVGRRDVDQMLAERRAHVAGDDVVEQRDRPVPTCSQARLNATTAAAATGANERAIGRHAEPALQRAAAPADARGRRDAVGAAPKTGGDALAQGCRRRGGSRPSRESSRAAGASPATFWAHRRRRAASAPRSRAGRRDRARRRRRRRSSGSRVGSCICFPHSPRAARGAMQDARSASAPRASRLERARAATSRCRSERRRCVRCRCRRDPPARAARALRDSDRKSGDRVVDLRRSALRIARAGGSSAAGAATCCQRVVVVVERDDRRPVGSP